MPMAVPLHATTPFTSRPAFAFVQFVVVLVTILLTSPPATAHGPGPDYLLLQSTYDTTAGGSTLGQVFRPTASGLLSGITIHVTQTGYIGGNIYTGEAPHASYHAFLYEWLGGPTDDPSSSQGALLTTTSGNRFSAPSTQYGWDRSGNVNTDLGFSADNLVPIRSDKYYYVVVQTDAYAVWGIASDSTLIDGSLRVDGTRTDGAAYLLVNNGPYGVIALQQPTKYQILTAPDSDWTFNYAQAYDGAFDNITVTLSDFYTSMLVDTFTVPLPANDPLGYHLVTVSHHLDHPGPFVATAQLRDCGIDPCGNGVSSAPLYFSLWGQYQTDYILDSHPPITEWHGSVGQLFKVENPGVLEQATMTFLVGANVWYYCCATYNAHIYDWTGTKTSNPPDALGALLTSAQPTRICSVLGSNPPGPQDLSWTFDPVFLAADHYYYLEITSANPGPDRGCYAPAAWGASFNQSLIDGNGDPLYLRMSGPLVLDPSFCASASDGTPCDDGNACTHGDICQAGGCVGTDDACVGTPTVTATPSVAATPSVTATPSPTPTPTATPAVLVALGDSYSSGEGAPLSGDGSNCGPADNDEPRGYDCGTHFGPRKRWWAKLSGRRSNHCHRSDNAYPRVFARTAGYDPHTGVRHYACSGATTADVLTHIQYDRELTAQIAHEFTGASLVTITIGGNDVGFPEIAYNCFAKGKCKSKYAPEGGDDRVTKKIQQVVPKLLDVYAGLAAKVPVDATIAVLGYPLFVADPNDLYEPSVCYQGIYNHVTQDDALWIRAKIQELNKAIDDTVTRVQQVSGRTNLKYVDVSGALHCHELCQSNDWVTAFGIEQPNTSLDVHLQPPFHPTVRGHQELAQCLSNFLSGSSACGDQRACF